MAEDAACGNPCGGEPLMCARCPELMGESEPYELDLDDYGGMFKECSSPCDYCDSPCEKCDLTVCLQGPDISDRPDYQHMKDLCYDPETGLYPDLGKCQSDYYRACRDCGYERLCGDRELNCPEYRAWEP